MTRGFVRKKAHDRGAGADAKTNKPTATAPTSDVSVKGKAKAQGDDAGVTTQPQFNPNESDYHRALANFTGKTPMTLLNEICQRNQWEKPQYQPFHQRGGKEGFFRCNVSIGKSDKRTGEVKLLKFTTPEEYGSANEARHHGAVLALHGVSPQLQMNRMLPPGYRDYWVRLEEESRQQVKLTTNASTSSSQTPRTSVSVQTSFDPFVEPPKKQPRPARSASEDWRPKLPQLHMSLSQRQLIESLLKTFEDTNPPKRAHKVTDAAMLNSTERQKVKNQLVGLGFRLAQVNESLEWCSTKDDALDWLCLRVPEDDLPPAFQPTKAIQVIVGSGNIEQNFREAAARRLAAFGFPLRLCEEALEMTFFDEDAARTVLWRRIAGSNADPLDVDSLSSQEREEHFIMEQSVLSSILGEQLLKTSDDGRHIVIGFTSVKDLHLHIFIPTTSLYPCQTAELFLVSDHIPAYIRIEGIKLAAQAAATFRGSPMIYEIFSWFESNWAAIIANPPPLLGIPKLFHQTNDTSELSEEEEDNIQDELEDDEEDAEEEDWIEPNEPVIDEEAENVWDNSDASTISDDASASTTEVVDEDLLEELPSSINQFTLSTWTEATPSSHDATTARIIQKLKSLQHNLPKLPGANSNPTKSEATLLRDLQKREANTSTSKPLPAHRFRETIVQAITSNPVVIISGETGCGKTTQIPQFVLDDAIRTGRGSLCNIICTQPRRIAATAVAQRVASERGDKLGQTVGYAIRLENKSSAATQLLFCTTGILLRRLQTDPSLRDVTHVIVDEVHERSVDSDILLALLRDLIISRRNDLRVILMSASIDGHAFASYFGDAPVLEIPGLTYPVQELYLEDIIEKTSYTMSRIPKKLKRRTTDDDPVDEEAVIAEFYRNKGYSEKTAQTLVHMLRRNPISKDREVAPIGEVDYSLIVATVHHIVQTYATGAILIFLPGMKEIRRCIETLTNEWSIESQKLWALPLHSSLTPAEQSKVFQKPTAGTRKVIAATNIAETSITIDDIVFVIDCGLSKELQFDDSIQTNALDATPISRANAQQRKGRAGRVQEGFCYRLYTRDSFEKMPPFQPVEIQRIPLEQVILQIKAIQSEDIFEMLHKLPSPPPQRRVDSAVANLCQLQILDKQTKQLTPLGSHVAALPLDFTLAKSLIFGAIFRCLDPILTITATLASRLPFLSPFEKRQEAKTARMRFCTFQSDLLGAHNAFVQWRQLRYSEKRTFCEENYLSWNVLETIDELRQQFVRSLQSIGFVSSSDDSEGRSLNVCSDRIQVVRAVVLAGVYPNIARVVLPKPLYQAIEGGTIEKPPEPSKIRLFTRDEGRVFIHPSSCLFSENQYAGSVIAFHHKQMSNSKIFLTDATVVSAYGALMFGGDVQVDHARGLIVVDNWLRFQAPGRIAVLTRKLRVQLNHVLEQKLRDPSIVVSESVVVEAILALLSSDGY